MPTQDNEPIECLVKVERVEEIMKKKVYGIGVRFMDMSTGDRARVNNYLKDEMSKRSIV